MRFERWMNGTIDHYKMVKLKRLLEKSSTKLFVIALFVSGVPYVGLAFALLVGINIISLLLINILTAVRFR